MKQYYIFKDSSMIERTTARKRAVSMIRQMQGQETHYLLRSEFSVIHGEVEIISLADDAEQNAPESSCTSSTELRPNERYHILKDGTQYGATPTREDALNMIRQARKHRPDAVFAIIRGTEEFIRYPKRRATHL